MKYVNLDGHQPFYEGYVLRQEGSRWIVSYSERGSERVLGLYRTEGEACDGLYDLVSRDSVMRRRP